MNEIDEQRIRLAHGNGGRLMRELIEGLFARHFSNPLLDTGGDASRVPLPGAGELMMTTDGFTVQPLEFPGGDIGALAVHGTVNDLAVAGAEPHYLTVNCFIEEGLEVALLERVVASMAKAARDAGVAVVAGDTKVLRRGEGGGLYLATTGLGLRDPALQLGLDRVRPGDALLVSGPVGDHGTAVLLAREEFGLSGELLSDQACVLDISRALRALPGLRFMRDPTRGGLATVAHEIATASGCTVHLDEPAIPVRDPVRAVCEMLGFDPLYLACEGRVVAVVDPAEADAAVAALQAIGHGQAARVGRIAEGQPRVVLHTELGGERMLEELEEDPLPRIC